MRVGISNQKGGVAKTTNTINVAGAIAELGHDVLVVDADPQGYLTNRLGLDEAYKAQSPTLFDALQEPQEHHTDEIATAHAEFDVLPSNIDMFRIEQKLIAAGWKPRERLSMLLDSSDVDETYDHVVIDAPPSLGPINDNVLLACENLLIPVSDSDMMKLALEHLLNQIETLESRYQTTIRERGVLVSNVEYPLDNEQREILEWFEDTFEGRCPLFEIRNRAAIKRSIKRNGSIFGEDAEATDQRDAYLAVAREVIDA